MPEQPEAVFTYGAPPLKFGPGAAAEIGYDLRVLGAARALVITDPGVAAAGHPERIAGQIAGYGIDVRVWDGVHVEPTDASLADAVAQARASGPWDAFVAVGGGSSIDTAKAVSLMLTNPGDLMDYVNPPVGRGLAPAHPLKPVIAVPTTTGTGAESTTVCVLDVLARQVKTGISHPRLRPALAVIDPELTLTQPAGVTAAAGMDILCHALESYTARWYATYERKQPEQRVPYCGANPGLGHVVRAGPAAAGGGVPGRRPRQCRRGSGRPGRAGRHGHRRDVRRDGLRQRRRAHPACLRLPHRGPGPRLPPGWTIPAPGRWSRTACRSR